MNDLATGGAPARVESTVGNTRQLDNPVDADAVETVEIGPDGQSVSKVEKDKADKEKAEKEKAEKDKAEKDKAEKDKAENETKDDSKSNGPGGILGPQLGTSDSSVAPGGNVSVMLTNGSGGSNQWIALAEVGAADNSYLLSIEVGPAVTARVWTIRMPMTPGAYEFRLFVKGNRGYALRGASRSQDTGVPKAMPTQNTRVATSRTVMVDPSTSGSTPPVIGTDPTPPVVGNDPPVVGNDPPVIVDEQPAPPPPPVVDEPPPAPPVVVDPPAPPPPPVVEPPPSTDPAISVSSQNVSVGARINATLINGTGDPYDWLVLAPVGSPDTEYWDWTYVPGGMATFTWGVTMPMAGTYEIRLLLHGGYTKVATSPTITVR
jgi:hypothetical protein